MISAKTLGPLLELLAKHGVSYIKTEDLELRFDEQKEQPTASLPILDQGNAKSIPLDAPSEPTPDIKHKIEELTNVMKLSDSDLVDRLFPDSVEVMQ